MAIIVRIDFMAGHLEGLTYQYLKKNKLRCSNRFLCAPALRITDIVNIEVASEESVKSLGWTTGGALAGAALAGGIGAIVGAIGSGQGTYSTIVVTFRDGKKSLAKANSTMMEVLRAHIFRLSSNPEREEVWRNSSILWKIFNPSKNPKNYGFPLAWWKKWLIICGLCWLAAVITGQDFVRKTGLYTKDNSKSPCANIKSDADWNRASSLWRMANPECKPRR